MGITFDIEQQKFQFDFEHDGTSDLVTLTGRGYQVEVFGKCFYYGYWKNQLVESINPEWRDLAPEISLHGPDCGSSPQ